MADIHQRLVDALNDLADVHGTQVLSMTFSRSDVPVDWDDETQQWVVEAGS
jgi:hypothetical protein